MKAKLSATLTEFYKFTTEPKHKENGTVRIYEISNFFEHIGLAFILMLFAAPMALPVPVPPGINVILATPIILLALQITAGKQNVWLPNKVKDKSIRTETLSNMLQSFIPKVEWLERFIRPRLTILNAPPIKNLFGLAGVLMALTICIPIPGTNTIPSFGIVMMCIGWITHDGLFTLVGAFIGLVWIAILCYVAIVFGPEAVEFAKDILLSRQKEA